MEGAEVNMQYCAFNITKQSFISLGVWIADTPLARFRGLARRARLRSDEALWVVPSRGLHAVGLFSWIDVLYLDANGRVLDTVENLRPWRVPRILRDCASILELPARRILDSGTQVGDQTLIGSPEDLRNFWESQANESVWRVRRLLAQERACSFPGQMSETHGG